MQSSASGSEVLVQAHHVPLQFLPESPRMLSGPQPHLPTLTNPRASQTNPNIGLSQLPAHFQYLPYPHSQQPQVRNFCEFFFSVEIDKKTYICTVFFFQFFYYRILGSQSRNPSVRMFPLFSVNIRSMCDFICTQHAVWVQQVYSDSRFQTHT